MTTETAYFTFDVERDNIISGNAEIEKFTGTNVLADILAHAKDSYTFLEDGENIEIIEGQFSDCWIKWLARNGEVTQDMVMPFNLEEDICIQPPGRHPGGPYYWITPGDTVYVVRSKRNA